MKREIVNLCAYHRIPHEECPSNCGHAIGYFDRIESFAKRDAARKEHDRKKYERMMAKKPPAICLYCSKEIIGHRRKFCDKQCRDDCVKRKVVDKPKVGWVPTHKECKQCGEQFLTNHPSSKFCSKECVDLSAKTKRLSLYKPVQNTPTPCTHCGKEFQRPTKNQRFCSTSCQGKDERRRNKKPLPIYSHCAYCHKETNHHRKYCNDQCSDKEGHRRDYKKRKALTPTKPTIETCIVCRVCQNEFKTKYPTQKFCGKKCKKTVRQKKKRAREKGKPKPNHVRIKNRLSGRLRELLRRKGKQKTNAIGKYMGCTPMEMLAHIDKQLEGTKMNWSNYGVFGWHLDHIIPCAKFNLTNEEHVMVCFNWRNIRPLWGVDNYGRQDNVSLLDALEIPKELFDMAAKIGVQLWV